MVFISRYVLLAAMVSICDLETVQASPISLDTSGAGSSDALHSSPARSDVLSSDDSHLPISKTNFNISEAKALASPHWTWPTFRNFPTAKLINEATTAFEDSFFLAWHAHNTPSTSNIFDRYFRPSDSEFVHEVFRSMFSPKDLWSPSRAFSKMTIWYGPNPESGVDLCNSMPNSLSYLTEYLNDLEGGVDLVICPRAMLIPLLKDIHCNTLSDHVDETFATLGGILLHEYVHWSNLVQTALKMKDPEVDRIGDFIGPDPPDGYGPYRVLKVREKADPTDNADNFRWFASEAYWHTICRPGLGQYGAGREEKMCNGAEGGGEMDLAERCHPI